MSGRRQPRPRGATPRRKRSARNGGGRVQKDPASSGSPMAPPPPPVPPDLTVEDADALDCGVCFLPLKPPIFQCDVGHVLCSPCYDKLNGGSKCHVCGVAMGAGSYRRCHAMERVVDSVRGPCPNARYGCDARPVYHGRDEHLLVCPHAPCHCPGEACNFAGSTAALLDHIKAAHSWPCFTAVGGYFSVYILRLGFNFLLADCTTGNDMSQQGATANVQCLLLMNVVRQPFGRTISVVWIDPHAGATAVRGGDRPASKEMECSFSYCKSQRLHKSNHHGGNQVMVHLQQSTFRVERTDLSNGLPKPNPEGCFQFLLPNSVLAADHDEDGIEVRVRGIVIK